jgi:hypothetical protein
MFDKKAFLASLTLETKIIIHLAAQLDAKKLAYRPTEKQRSAEELLQYLTIMGSAATTFALTGAWDHWEALADKSKAVTLATFPKAMKAQLSLITKILATTNDGALKRKKAKAFNGATMSLGACLVEVVLKQYAAYRMQFFLYAKASGLPDLGSSDCWAGKSPKKAKPAPVKKAKAKGTKAKAAKASKA